MHSPSRFFLSLVVLLTVSWLCHPAPAADETPKTSASPFIAHVLDDAENVYSVQFSTDAKRLRAGSEKKLREWSVSDWKQLGTYMTEPIGTKVEPTAIRAIDVANKYPLFIEAQANGFSIHSDGDFRTQSWVPTKGPQLRGIRFSPDDKWIAVSGGASIALFPLENYYKDGIFYVGGKDGLPIKIIEAKGPVLAFAFVDNHRMALCEETKDESTIVEIYDIETGKSTGQQFQGTTVACSPDGRTLATDRLLIDIGKKLSVRKRLENAHVAYHIAFDGDSKWFVTGGADGRLMLRSTATGERVGVVDAHRREVVALAMSPDGKYIASSGMSHVDDKGIKIWDVKKILAEKPQPLEKSILACDHEISFAQITSDGKLDAETAGQRTTWNLRDALNGAATPTTVQFDVTDFDPLRWAIADMVAASPNNRVRVAGDGARVLLWKNSTDAKSSAAALDYSSGDASLFVPGRQGTRVSPDQSVVAIYESLDRPYVHLFDARSGRRLGTLHPEFKNIVAIEFSPDGRELAVLGVPRPPSDRHFCELWNVQHQTRVGSVEGRMEFPAHPGGAVRFSSDGNAILAGNWVIDRSTLRPLSVLQQTDDASKAAIRALNSVALPDKHVGWVVTATHSLLSFWNADTGQLIKQIDVPLPDVGDFDEPLATVLVSSDGNATVVVDHGTTSAFVYDSHELLQGHKLRLPLDDIERGATIIALADSLSSFAVSTANPELDAYFRERATKLAKELKIDLTLPETIDGKFPYLVSIRGQVSDQIAKQYGKRAGALFITALDARVLSRQYEWTKGKKVATAEEACQEDRVALELPETFFRGMLVSMNQQRPFVEVLTESQLMGQRLSDQVPVEHPSTAKEITFDRAAYYNEMADALRDDLPAAIQWRSRAIYELQSVGTDSAELWWQRGQASQLLGDFRAAIDDYKSALHIDPSHIPSLRELAIIFGSCPDATLRNGKEAVTLVESMHKRMDQEKLSPTVRSLLAEVVAYAAAGDFDTAIQRQVQLAKLASPNLEDPESFARKRFKDHTPVILSADQPTPLIKSIEETPYAAETWRLFDSLLTSLKRQVVNRKPSFAGDVNDMIRTLKLEPLTIPEPLKTDSIGAVLDAARKSWSQQIVKQYGPTARELFEFGAFLDLIELNYDDEKADIVRGLSRVLEQGTRYVKLPAEEFEELKRSVTKGAKTADVRTATRNLRTAVNRQLPLPTAGNAPG